MSGEADKPMGSGAETIFTAALALAPAERAAYLEQACGQDQQLRQRVEALLRANEAPEGFLPEKPGVPATEDPFPTSVLAASLTEQPGDTIGRYKLREKIGEGGCGVVYMAEQEEPVRRKVALKVIKLGMDTRQVVARFEAERQALALMDHANIAKVFDAGATETGRPYFVMELVGGVRITDYCDQNQLTTRQRLDLFIQVCRAIQHAHQKGVIHRDIKPSNVLIAMQDGVAVPKVIDFGIAKATQGRLIDQTVFTAFEQFLGTPAYMSPEQAQLGGLDVDTRSDIYSLGVLLYELLTGKTPFDTQEMLAGGLDEIRRTIREKEPARPSTRLSTMAIGELKTAAERRTSDAARLIHVVRGDLDWIVMKCLEKDRARRYETANGLASDLQRHLNNEPVLARPRSKLHEFHKTVRRHKFGFAATAAIIIVLAAGALVSTLQAVRAKRAEREHSRLRQQAQRAQANEAGERLKAESEAAKSQQVAQFLKDMLSGISPSVALGRDTKMLQEILGQTAQRLDKLTNQPAVEADLRATLGGVYYDLGDYAKATAMHERALALRRKLYGSTNADVARSAYGLAEALRKVYYGDVNGESSKFAEAARLFREALATQRKFFGEQNLEVAQTLYGLGMWYRALGDDTNAETNFREALTIQTNLLGQTNAAVAWTLDMLALSLTLERRVDEAEQYARQALTVCTTLYPDGHPLLGHSLQNLGLILHGNGELEEAEDRYRQALVVRRKVLLPDHPDLRETVSSLANLLSKRGKAPEGEQLWRDLIAARKRLRGDADPSVAEPLLTLGKVLWAQGRSADAVAAYREAEESGDNSIQFNLGDMYRSGEMVHRDNSAALRCYRKAAEQNNQYAQYALGEMYRNGEGVQQDKSVAVRWYQKAAELNHKWALGALGDMYRNGEGIQQDKSVAVAWYKKAAEQGNEWAQDKLGRMYQDGEGVAKDPAEASRWYRQAAEQGILSAQRSLAGMYLRGEGGVKDVTEAARWYGKAKEQVEKAARGGDEQALNDYAWLLATCDIAEIRDGTNAVQYAEAAVAKSKRNNPLILDTLAAAYAEAGEFTKAVRVQKEAMALVHKESVKNDLATRLKLYESNTPYRDR
jgi:serine/threonine protein kinase/TPR repeat protein